MTEDELDRIKKSFVRSSDECPMEVACLLTVMKYYGGQQDARTLAAVSYTHLTLPTKA